LALATLFLYNWSVQLFDAPTPDYPLNYVLAIGWTLLMVPWLVFAFQDWRRNRQRSRYAKLS
jgi:hypothetical protein